MRDLATAATIVQTVMGRMLQTELGDAVIDVEAMMTALHQSVEAVADLLDPDEVFDCVIEPGSAPVDECEHGPFSKYRIMHIGDVCIECNPEWSVRAAL